MVTNPPQIKKSKISHWLPWDFECQGIINNQQNYESWFGEFQIGDNKPQRLLNDK